jgi:hypothetical protein
MEDMASSGKKKTTMAKLARESRLRERRLNKQAKKEARKQGAPDQLESPRASLNATTAETAESGPGQDALEPIVQPPAGVG